VVANCDHIQIIDSFVAMRRFLYEDAAIFRRLDTLERKQLETDSKFMIFHGYSSVGRTKVTSENGKALQEPETD
jgi:hypothetical protein